MHCQKGVALQEEHRQTGTKDEEHQKKVFHEDARKAPSGFILLRMHTYVYFPHEEEVHVHVQFTSGCTSLVLNILPTNGGQACRTLFSSSSLWGFASPREETSHSVLCMTERKWALPEADIWLRWFSACLSLDPSLLSLSPSFSLFFFSPFLLFIANDLYQPTQYAEFVFFLHPSVVCVLSFGHS